MTRRDLLGTCAALAAPDPMPMVPFGPHQVSRLIVGGNPVSANSHVSGKLDSEMRDYFTAANIKKMLAACERAGINTWQSRADRHIMRLLHEYRQEGGKLQWVAQTASEYGDLKRNLREITSLKPIGIYHHGSQTDKFWLADQFEQVHENLKAIRQTGARVGLGTHIPEVVDYVESKGWDLDFYMTCVYNLSRGENFQDTDREKMLARVKRISKPCLIFKIYGATRQCATPETRQAAVELAFRYAKPGDAVVVGMFPKYSEQVVENCRLIIRYSKG